MHAYSSDKDFVYLGLEISNLKTYSKNIQEIGFGFSEISGKITIMTVIPQNQCERLLSRFSQHSRLFSIQA